MNRKNKYISMVLATVMVMSPMVGGMSCIGGFPVLAEIRSEDYQLGSPSNAGKDDYDNATPSNASQKKRALRSGLYPSFDLSADSANIYSVGKYIIQQTGDEANDIYISNDCELWFDGLNGNIEIYIGDSVKKVEIHLLSDCRIEGFAQTAASAKYIIDSRDFQGQITDSRTLKTFEEGRRLCVPGNGEIIINSVDLEGGVWSDSYWDEDRDEYKYGASNLVMTGGSITGDIIFTKTDYALGSKYSLMQKPDGTVTLDGTEIYTHQIMASSLNLNDCAVNSDENGSLDLNTPQIDANNVQWNSEKWIEIWGKGKFVDNKIKSQSLALSNCEFIFQNTDVEVDDLSIIPSGNWNEGACKITWDACTIKAGWLGIQNSYDEEEDEIFGIDVTFNACIVDVEDRLDVEAWGSAAVNLEIKNNSKVTVKGMDEEYSTMALVLVGNANVTVSDSEVILDSHVTSRATAIFGERQKILDTWYDPKLTLTGKMVIRNDGVTVVHDHIMKIVNSDTKEEMKHVEIGIPRIPGQSYDDAFPLPTLTGNKRNDFVAIAQSQLDYVQSATGETVYSQWADQPGISKSIFPTKASSEQFREFFETMGRYYVMDGGCTPEDQNGNCKGVK